jgi:hypothetical protein
MAEVISCRLKLPPSLKSAESCGPVDSLKALLSLICKMLFGGTCGLSMGSRKNMRTMSKKILTKTEMIRRRINLNMALPSTFVLLKQLKVKSKGWYTKEPSNFS